MDETEEPKELPYEIAEAGLHLCDCMNCSSRVDPSYHAFQCSYRIWYFQTLRSQRSE